MYSTDPTPPPQSPIENRQTTQTSAKSKACKDEWCSTGFMKLGCPSCFLVGLAILPIELTIRGTRRLVSGPTDSINP